MLIPEISLLASTAGLFFALISCLLVLVSKRKMHERMDELRFELEVHLSANHEMAKQLRGLQKAASSKTSSSITEGQASESFANSADRDGDDRHDLWEDSYRTAASGSAKFGSNSTPTQEYAPKAGPSLAEKLGLSQSEADIITHLRPRKKRLMDTA